MKIYTRTGDAGSTALFGGARVLKNDPRVAAYGDVDELNACLGLVRAQRDLPAEVTQLLEAVQKDLFAIGSRLADPSERNVTRGDKVVVSEADIQRLADRRLRVAALAVGRARSGNSDRRSPGGHRARSMGRRDRDGPWRTRHRMRRHPRTGLTGARAKDLRGREAGSRKAMRSGYHSTSGWAAP